MHKNRIPQWLYPLLIALALVTTGWLALPAFAAGAAIGGTVRNESGDPLVNITVLLSRNMAPIYGYEQWNYLNTTVTDDSGNYTFTELEGGIYRIQFQDDNIPPAYGTIYYNQIATAATATDVNLGENETIGAIDAQLPLRGALGGRVTDSQGTPLAGIAVHMDKEWSFYDGTIYWNTAAFTTTTASGFYRLNALEPGNYRLTFQDSDGVPNHIGEIYDDADSYETATTVVVSAGQLITGINAALDETGAITGVVTIDSGQPLANATVSLYRRIEDPSFPFWQTIQSTYTNERGGYQFQWLLPGTYRLYFVDGNNPPLYSYEYYENAETLEGATDIEVGSGITVTGINVQLEQFSKIAGRVTDNEGRPLENISVTIYGFHPTNNYWYDQQIVQTDGNGHYEFPTLVGGPYRLAFNQAYVYPPQYEPEFYQNAATLEAATTINLARSEVIDNVDVQLEQYAQIAGRVTDIHGQPIAGIDITPYQIFEEGASWNQLPGATTGPSGIYTLTGLVEGVYALSFQSACCQQRYVPEFYDDATDLYTGARLALARGQVLTGIDAQLDAYGTISGRVTNERGEPLYDIFVDALYPQEDAGEIIWNSLYGAYTDDNGEYQIEQLPANNYRVRFNYGHDDGYVAAYWQDTLDFDSATAISLPLNSVATGIDAQLVQGASLRGALQTVDGRVTNLGAWLYQYAPYTDGGDPWEPLQTDYGSYNGVFTFRGLDAGTYRLGFYDNQNPGYRREYPKPALHGARPSFELTLGQAITGISALLSWPTDQIFRPMPMMIIPSLKVALVRLDSNAYSVLDNDKNDVEQWAEQLHAIDNATTPRPE
ncbi:MAG: carboxypeptidase regulatory-like domain-containing protein [Caldilineaceae bacterium]